jgi:bifunctional non-homologous end joining protein LigD
VKPRTQKTLTRTVTPKRRRATTLKAISGAVRGPLPTFVEPCLATLVAAPPEGDEWVHEIKFDGYRIEARIDGEDVTLLTRNGLDWTSRFGTIPRLLSELHQGTALIDGELVVEDSEGHSSFTALAETLKSGRAESFVLQCFDLLYLDGVNLMGAALTERKAILEQLLGRRSKSGQIRYSEHFASNGARMLAEACRLGLEGIISKRADRPYRPGRHDDWFKSKCIQTDEFVIVGYVESTAAANAIGALVLGYYDRKRLIYAGRVGTGFTHRSAADLHRLLKPLRAASPPVASKLTGLQQKGVVWVRPDLVAQVEYRAWTADNLLRHASFKGLREDKPARDVKRPAVKMRRL